MKAVYLLLLSVVINFLPSLSNAGTGIPVDSIYIRQIQENDSGKLFLILNNLILPSPCGLASQNVNSTIDSIEVTLCYYYPGDATVFCHSFDSVYLGTYPTGSYQFKIVIKAVRFPDGGCFNPTRQDSFFLNFSVTTALDAEVIGRSSWKISPNPTNSLINISSPSLNSNTTLQITTTDGRVVLEQSAAMQNNWQVDVSNLAKGLYFAILETEQGRVVRRFVRE